HGGVGAREDPGDGRAPRDGCDAEGHPVPVPQRGGADLGGRRRRGNTGGGRAESRNSAVRRDQDDHLVHERVRGVWRVVVGGCSLWNRSGLQGRKAGSGGMSQIRMTFSAAALRAVGRFLHFVQDGVSAACLGMLLAAEVAGAQQTVTLKQAVDLAQKQGYQARAAVATRDAARARDKSFTRGLLPQISLQATNAFFDFFVAKKTLENAVFNAATNDTLYTLNKGRLEVGKIGENDLLQSELALLRARQSADNARLEYERTLDALRLSLNVDRSSALDVAVPSDIPVFEPDTAIAVAQALANRAQARQLELDGIQARRHVSE